MSQTIYWNEPFSVLQHGQLRGRGRKLQPVPDHQRSSACQQQGQWHVHQGILKNRHETRGGLIPVNHLLIVNLVNY